MMKNILFSILLSLLFHLANAQTVNEIEYFIDTDPGVGNASSVPFTVASEVDISFTANLVTQPQGLHTFYIRAMDNDLNWSLLQYQSFLVMGNVANPDITQVEYFFDESTNGLGYETQIQINADTTISQVVSVDISALQQGMHTIYVRAKDESGNWSLQQSHSFIKLNNLLNPELVQIEYFIDTSVNGCGNETQIPFTQATTFNQMVSIDLSGLAQGVHTLYIRAKDELGNWSLQQYQSFYINSISANPQIARLEYYFNEDPGVGNGTQLFFSTVDTLEKVFNISLRGLPNGINTLYIRAKDNNGSWSLVSVKQFTIEAPTIPLTNVALYAEVFGNRHIRLYWDEVDGAVNYRLFRADSIDGCYKQIYWAAANQYEDCGQHLNPNTTYYYKMKSENLAGISGFSDVISATTTDTPPQLADLRPQILIVDTTLWTVGDQQVVDISVLNTGFPDNRPYKAQLYLSSQPRITGWDIPLGDPIVFEGQESVLRHETYTFYVQDLTGGVYYLGVEVDPENEIEEEDGSNNFKMSGVKITVLNTSGDQLADLKGVIKNETKVWKIGDTCVIGLEEQNVGSASAIDHSSQFYLSEDEILSPDDIAIGSAFLSGNIALAETVNQSQDIILSNTISPGQYYLAAVVDTENEVEELFEANNDYFFDDPIEIVGETSGFVISGWVRDAHSELDNKGLSGVKFKGLNRETDTNGYFEIPVLAGSSVTLTPIYSEDDLFEYEFSPQSISFQNVNSNIEYQVFAGLCRDRVFLEISKNTMLLTATTIGSMSKNPLFRNTAEAVTVLDQTMSIYNILAKDDDDITKYFDLAQLLVENIGGPYGRVAGAYIYISKEILNQIGNITTNLSGRNLIYNAENSIFKIKVIHDRWAFFDNDIEPDKYKNYLDASLHMYEQTDDGKLIDKAVREFTVYKEAGNDYLELSGGTMQTYGNVSWMSLQRNYFLELYWKDSHGNVIQKIILPVMEPYVTAQNNITFKIHLYTDQSPDFANGAYKLQIK